MRDTEITGCNRWGMRLAYGAKGRPSPRAPARHQAAQAGHAGPRPPSLPPRSKANTVRLFQLPTSFSLTSPFLTCQVCPPVSQPEVVSPRHPGAEAAVSGTGCCSRRRTRSPAPGWSPPSVPAPLTLSVLSFRSLHRGRREARADDARGKGNTKLLARMPPGPAARSGAPRSHARQTPRPRLRSSGPARYLGVQAGGRHAS